MGKSFTGSVRYPATPNRRMAIMTSVVITGRRMKSSVMFKNQLRHERGKSSTDCIGWRRRRGIWPEGRAGRASPSPRSPARMLNRPGCKAESAGVPESLLPGPSGTHTSDAPDLSSHRGRRRRLHWRRLSGKPRTGAAGPIQNGPRAPEADSSECYNQGCFLRCHPRLTLRFRCRRSPGLVGKAVAVLRDSRAGRL